MDGEASKSERERWIASADALEAQIDDKRRRLAKLQGLPEPRLAPSLRGRAKASSVSYLERRLARSVPATAFEAFVATIQARLSVVGWSRPEGPELTWQSAAASVDLELSVKPAEDGATLLSITYDPQSLTTMATLTRMMGLMLAVTGVVIALAIAHHSAQLVPSIALGVASVMVGGLSVWLGSVLAARRRAHGLQQLETLCDSLAADLELAAEAAAPTPAADITGAALLDASGPLGEEGLRRALPR